MTGHGCQVMERRLILVKHSHPQVDPDVTAAEWRLSDVGKARCLALADLLRSYNVEALVASPEPKAIETAELVGERLGLSVEVVGGLQEHDRGNVSFYESHDEFKEVVKRLFERPDELVMGRETAVQARTRFAKALDDVLANHSTGNIAVVTHGTVISLYIGQVAGVGAYDLWGRLGLPSFTVLSLPDLRLVETVESIE